MLDLDVIGGLAASALTPALSLRERGLAGSLALVERSVGGRFS
jgi:hypothetical protein